MNNWVSSSSKQNPVILCQILVRSVMAGELNLALVTAPLENSQITTAAFAQAPLYAALPQIRAAAQEKDITLQVRLRIR